MDRELINPNLHIVLVHFPLALLIVGTLIELFSFLWRRSGFRQAGWWMILLGALGGIPTALSGIYAMNDVARGGAENLPPTAVSWNEAVRVSALTSSQWQALTDHVRLQSWAVILSVLASVLWIAASDGWRTRLRLPLLLVLLISVGLMVAGAYHGGEAVYEYGTGVSLSRSNSKMQAAPAVLTATQPGAPTTELTITTPSSSAPTTATTGSLAGYSRYLGPIQELIPPIQMHLILAGVAVALSLAALGLSIRKITQGAPVPQVDHIAAALGGTQPAAGDSTEIVMADTQDLMSPPLPVGRFWLLAFLAAVLSAGIGYCMLVHSTNTWSAGELWKGIIKENIRQMAHVIAGVAVVLLPLILAALSRWAPRQKFFLALFALLLLAVVAFQLWVGILLLYDTRHGLLTGFN